MCVRTEHVPADKPSLTSLRAFEATVRLGTVTAAAQELHFTHSAVSRQVRAVEAHVGRPLFERRNRGLHPTPVGRRLAAGIADVTERLDGELRDARADRHQGLVLSCEPTLLMRWVIPRLPALIAAAPELTCRLVASGGPVAFSREGIDLAVRRNDFPIAAGTHVAELMPEHIGPVCRPDIAATLHDPADLATTTLLQTATRPDAWADWAGRNGGSTDRVATQHFEHFYLALQAASAGLGVAIASRAMVVDDLATGQLVAPFGFTPDGSRYLLLSANSLDDGNNLVVRRWLQDAAQGDGLLPG